MANVNSKSKPLPPRATEELAKISSWLQDDVANFHTVNSIRICGNTDGLATVTADLLREFAAEVKFVSSQNRITAIHFDHTAVVPVEQGWVVDLIPTYIMGETTTVDGREVKLGEYVHITKDVTVSGGFLAVLLLSQLGE